MRLAGLLLVSSALLVARVAPETTSQPLLLFDVINNDVFADEVMGSVNGTGPLHAIKVIGGNRYLFVFSANQRASLNHLTFPPGSVVKQYQVLHSGDYFRFYGVDWTTTDTPTSLTSGRINFIEWDVFVKPGTNQSEFSSLMAAYGSRYRKDDAFSDILVYGALGQFPPKFFYFLNPTSHASLHINVLTGMGSIGGPGQSYVRTRHVILM